jgi:cell division ATPase FtsA
VVLTGGASLLNGFDKMAESLLGLPVRIGQPVNVKGRMAAVSNPAYSAAVGLVAYGCGSSVEGGLHPDVFADAFAGVKEWLKGIFGSKGLIQINNKKEGGMLCLKSKR